MQHHQHHHLHPPHEVQSFFLLSVRCGGGVDEGEREGRGERGREGGAREGKEEMKNENESNNEVFDKNKLFQLLLLFLFYLSPLVLSSFLALLPCLRHLEGAGVKKGGEGEGEGEEEGRERERERIRIFPDFYLLWGFVWECLESLKWKVRREEIKIKIKNQIKTK